MQQHSDSTAQDLVLIGGGHSHAIALRQLGMKPPAGVRLTLITDVSHTPYSGMLPGYVAGLYGFDDCHIDLRPLSQFAGAVMVLDAAVGLDLQQNRVLLANHPPIAFDLLSIDIGSTPARSTVPGAAEYTIPVKPISKFLQQWDQLVAQLTAHPKRLRIAVVGGGAGGVELMLAIQARLSRLYQSLGQSPDWLELHLLHRGDCLVPERSHWVGQRLHRSLTDRGVQVHLSTSVTAISALARDLTADLTPKQIACDSGLRLDCDWIFWVTQASAANWLAQSGLATDDRGFLQVNDCLQSLSHPQVFAAGDVATMVNHARPKAGVFAVRQGKPLVQNLRHALTHTALQSFVPQKEFLILIGTADRAAIASRGGLGLGPYGWLWRWKDSIDRKFMRQFSDLSAEMPIADRADQQPVMHCAGCGSKVGSSVLEQALKRIQQNQANWLERSDVLVGLKQPDDAAVLHIPADRVLVQTVDHFPALVNDPYIFGQICTHHCLNDLFAMGATPQSALTIVTLPYATEAKQTEILYQLLSGAVQALSEAGAALVGGHTTEGSELVFGLTCNGIADPAQLWQKNGMQPGQVLILTKALGTGTLFAADMQLKAKGRWIEAAIDSMLQSNQAAAACLRQFGATACTDVTGFGLAGHLLELIRASQVTVELDLHTLPVLAGAKETLTAGIVSSLYPQNLRAAQQIATDHQPTYPLFSLLFDPQTSGGLLASVPIEQAEACLSTLQNLGYPEARPIGRVLPPAGGLPLIVKR